MSEEQAQEIERILQAAANLEFSLEGLDDHPLVFATDATVTADASGLYVTFGQYAPPPFLTIADQARFVDLGYVPYPVVARIALSEQVALKLRLQLAEQLKTYRDAKRGYDNWLREVGGSVDEDRSSAEQAEPTTPDNSSQATVGDSGG